MLLMFPMDVSHADHVLAFQEAFHRPMVKHLFGYFWSMFKRAGITKRYGYTCYKNPSQCKPVSGFFILY